MVGAGTLASREPRPGAEELGAASPFRSGVRRGFAPPCSDGPSPGHLPAGLAEGRSCISDEVLAGGVLVPGVAKGVPGPCASPGLQ